MRNASLIINIDFLRQIIHTRSIADNYVFLIDERQLFWSNRLLTPPKNSDCNHSIFLMSTFKKILCTLFTEKNNSNWSMLIAGPIGFLKSFKITNTIFYLKVYSPIAFQIYNFQRNTGFFSVEKSFGQIASNQ